MPRTFRVGSFEGDSVALSVRCITCKRPGRVGVDLDETPLLFGCLVCGQQWSAYKQSPSLPIAGSEWSMPLFGRHRMQTSI